jgi:hypothetical protein
VRFYRGLRWWEIVDFFATSRSLLPDEPVVADLPPEAVNVAEVYAQLTHDIRASAWTVPDFKHAVRLTRLIDAVGLAANTGIRQQIGDWPQ